MAKYRVTVFTGDYIVRQLTANRERCDVYIEQHFDAKLNDRESDADNYCSVLVAHNASPRSKAIAKTYAAKCAKATGLPNAGVRQVAYGKHGDGNMRHTMMPAVLLESLFISDMSQAEFASSEAGQEMLAQLIVDTVVEHFPDGCHVALSAGHRGQTSKNDPGAPAANGRWEGDLAVQVVAKAAALFRKLDTEAVANA